MASGSTPFGVEHDIGKRCKMCNTTDFLPFRCDRCGDSFCDEHRTYAQHRCTHVEGKSKVVPKCPLCDESIVVRAGEDVNEVISAHIEAGCHSQKKKYIYEHKCHVKGCRKREAIECICKQCGLNFCLQHRTVMAHKCKARGHMTHNAMAAQLRVGEERERVRARDAADNNRRDADLRNQRAHDARRQQSVHNGAPRGRHDQRQAVAGTSRPARPQPSTTDPMYAASQDEEELALQEAIAASLRDQERERSGLSSRCQVS